MPPGRSSVPLRRRHTPGTLATKCCEHPERCRVAQRGDQRRRLAESHTGKPAGTSHATPASREGHPCQIQHSQPAHSGRYLLSAVVRPRSSFLAHVVVGGVSLAVDVVLLVALHRVLGLTAATVIAFGASVAVNFTLNRALHVRGERSQEQLLRYGALLGGNALVTLGIVTAGHRWYLVAKFVAVAVTTTWNFPLYRRWVFA
jgi:putative flippase GtrA